MNFQDLTKDQVFAIKEFVDRAVEYFPELEEIDVYDDLEEFCELTFDQDQEEHNAAYFAKAFGHMCFRRYEEFFRRDGDEAISYDLPALRTLYSDNEELIRTVLRLALVAIGGNVTEVTENRDMVTATINLSLEIINEKR